MATITRAAPETAAKPATARFYERWWRDVRTWGDPVSRDLGTSGELFVARLRLGLVVLLAIIPVNAVRVSPASVENWIGLGLIVLSLGFSLVFLGLARRPMPPSWLGFATSQFDIAMISVGSLGFLLAGRPIITTNSLVHFTIYFPALAATCLRYDPRVCLAAGAAAVLEHGALAWWVGTHSPAHALQTGQYGALAWDTQFGRIELLLIATVLNTAIVVRSRRFWMSSMRDRLTGLFNRGFLDETLDRLVAVRQISREPFAVAIVDLDHFKKINDEFGHLVGDVALRRAATELQEAFRGKDVIARIGGEEFAVVLIDMDPRTAVERLQAWRQRLSLDPQKPRLSASVGVAFFPADGVDPRDLLDAADQRLYRAKRGGRNRLISDDVSGGTPTPAPSASYSTLPSKNQR